MSNEEEVPSTLIKKKTKQKTPNKEHQQKPQQSNKVVIDYDQIVIALPHFPKPPKIRIKPLVGTPISKENKVNGVSDGKEQRLEDKKKKKKVKLGERDDTQMGKGAIPNGVDGFELKPCLSGGKDENMEGKKKKKKKKKKKVKLGERDDTQMGKGVISNGFDGKDESMEGKKEMGEGVYSNGVDDVEGVNKVVKRRRVWSVSGREESVECRFPVNRIVRIVKSQVDDYKLGHEAVFLFNKAAEKFIELFSEDAYDCALEEKKNFVGYKHLSSAVSKEKRLDFLSDFVPEKITAEKALAGWKSAETLPT